MMDKTTADADLHARLDIIHAVEGDNRAIDAARAWNTLHEDLGYFTDQPTRFRLNEITRDRLIVHTRKDSTHAVLAVGSFTLEVRKSQRLEKMFLVFLGILAAVTVLSLWR